MRLSKIFHIFLSLLLMSAAYASDHHHHHGGKKKASEPTTVLSEESIYNIDSKLLDEKGKEVRLAEFRGKPVVISMAYTGCVYTCPMILAQMQQIEKALQAQGNTDAIFVLVSFDPEKDTPKVMADYAKKRNLSSQWHLLTAKSDKAPREVASLLGIKYKKVEGGDYDHSFIISALDKEGVIKGQSVGANSDPKELLKYLKKETKN